MSDTLERHYFYSDDHQIIYYSKPLAEIPHETTLIYLGSSDNERPKMVAAFFVQANKVAVGYRLRSL